MVIYLIIINLFVFILMAIDKNNAIKNKSRIPNKIFYLFSICGGFIGISMGIILINHKTTRDMYYIMIAVGIIVWSGIIIFVESK